MFVNQISDKVLESAVQRKALDQYPNLHLPSTAPSTAAPATTALQYTSSRQSYEGSSHRWDGVIYDRQWTLLKVWMVASDAFDSVAFCLCLIELTSVPTLPLHTPKAKS